MVLDLTPHSQKIEYINETGSNNNRYSKIWGSSEDTLEKI